MSSVEGKRFLTLAEAAKWTQQGEQEILYQIHSGKLPAVLEHASGVYRINEIDLERLKRAQR
jgi:hypothetical protein